MASKSVDKQVMDLLVTLQQKKTEIAAMKSRPQWKTNCSLGKDPESTQGRCNIQVISDSAKLISLYAFLTQQENFMAAAAEELGLEFDGKWQGYQISEWKDDLKTAASRLSIKKKEEELKSLDARVNNLVSPEQRREMELEALQQILGD